MVTLNPAPENPLDSACRQCIFSRTLPRRGFTSSKLGVPHANKRAPLAPVPGSKGFYSYRFARKFIIQYALSECVNTLTESNSAYPATSGRRIDQSSWKTASIQRCPMRQ
jgi:hypothetical protein